MWLKSTDGQWINTDHIIRIYLHDVHENVDFGIVAESPVLGGRDVSAAHGRLLLPESPYFAKNFININKICVLSSF